MAWRWALSWSSSLASARAALRVGQQAADADSHVFQTPGRVQARAGRKAEIGRLDMGQIAPGHLQQGAHAVAAASGAHTRQALVDQTPVVLVQRHQVGNRAQRDQVQPLVQARFRTPLEPAQLAQTAAQGQGGVEHHANASQRRRTESLAGQVGIDDGFGGRQFRPRQVMISDHHLHPAPPGSGYPGNRTDPLVNGHQHRRAGRFDFFDQGRTETVAVAEAIGYQPAHLARAQAGQGAHRQRRTGGAISIKVTDHQDGFTAHDGFGEDIGGLIQTAQARRQQALERVVRRLTLAARGQHPGHHRMQPRQVHRSRRTTRDRDRTDHASGPARRRQSCQA